MTDVWDWISKAMQGFIDARDRPRYDMGRLFFAGLESIRKDPDMAISLFDRGKAAAEALNEPWWVILCDHWKCQVLLEKTRNIAAAAQLSSELIQTTDGKTQYDGLPQLVCLHDDHAGAMLYTDPLGFAAEIEADCQVIDTQGRDQASCLHCSRATRILASLAHEDLDGAEKAALEGLKRCNTDGASHYLPIYYCALCSLSASRKDWSRLAHWSKAGETFYGKMGTEAGNIELLMWGALAALKTHGAQASLQPYKKARRAGKSENFKMTHGYFDALALYHEENGRLKLAIVSRKMQLDNSTGSPYLECASRLERIRLLKASGLPVDVEQASLNTAATQLRNPAAIAERLNAILREA